MRNISLHSCIPPGRLFPAHPWAHWAALAGRELLQGTTELLGGAGAAEPIALTRDQCGVPAAAAG